MIVDLALILDTSALLGYGYSRMGIWELIDSLDGHLFGATRLCVRRAGEVAELAGDDILVTLRQLLEHPDFVALPEPDADPRYREALHALFFPRPDVVSTLLASRLHHGCEIATYEPEEYTANGVQYGDILPLEDSW